MFGLANLTIKNCVNTVDPSDAPVFYGALEFYEGEEAREKIRPKFAKMLNNYPESYETQEINPETSEEFEYYYLGGIGSASSHAVLINREHRDGKISILESLGNGKIEARFCPIRGHFSSEQLREVFTRLESKSPKEISEIENSIRNDVLKRFDFSPQKNVSVITS